MFPVLPNTFLNSNNLSESVITSSDSNKNHHQYKCSRIPTPNPKINDKCISSVKLKFENNLIDTSSASAIDTGVFAAEFLKKNTKSIEMSSAELLLFHPSVKKKLKIGISKEGYLRPLEQFSLNWLRNVKLSSDVHSNNSLIEITSNGLIQIRILKDILPEQEITCWFTENILMHMAIPFLVPTNIRGNNCYTCHICNLSYESPNPLKIHLALLCNQQSTDILWIRLHHSLQKLNLPLSDELFRNSNTNYSLELSSSSLTSSSFLFPSPLTFLSQQRQQRLSAFRPVVSTITTSTNNTSSSPSPLMSSSFLPSSHNPHHHHHQQSQSQISHSPSILSNAAAQIETIVSNMGSSKQGHLCIYCGKIYSRKYGLKIHIRTHTGFKPLKCKFCFRPFGDPSNLNKHIRLHMQSTRNSIYKCHLCSKIMTRRRDLQRHMQTRHSEVSSSMTNTTAVATGKRDSSSDDD